jgi:hypothetical protein
MSDPTRLLSGEANQFEKELLGSWDSEQPSDAARARVLAMVSLGAGAAAGTAAIVGKAGAAAGGSIAPKAGALGAAALAKWLVIGAVGVMTAGAALVYVRHAQNERAAGATHAPPLAPTVVPAAPVRAVPPSDAPAVTAPVATEAPARSAPSQRRTEKSGRATDDALGDQVSALDRARRALADGDAPGALRQLDDYEGRFPHGALVEEAEVLRVESLLAAGDSAAAARVGARFLAAHPGSPHAARVRALLGQAPGP